MAQGGGKKLYTLINIIFKKLNIYILKISLKETELEDFQSMDLNLKMKTST